MMAGKKDEVFTIKFTYKRKPIELTVKTDYPAGPECLGCDYDIFDQRKHLYTINQCNNEDDMKCWEIKKKPATGHDPELASAIGRAIDKHYH